jgi:Tfp pilus assembly protein PilO
MAAKTLAPRGAKKTWSVHACGAGIVLMVVVGFHQGIHAPWQRDREAREARIVQLHKLIATGDAVIEQHRQLSERLAVLRKSTGEVQRRMPPKVAPSLFIEKLSQTAAELGVDVQQCSAAAPEVFPDHSRVDVNCRFSGSYASICRCLAAVDQFPQLSKVSQLEISSGANSSAYPAQVTFQLYYRHERHDKEVKQGT